jgi:hypothetical protein
MERQPREFSTCSKCKWVAYCCKDHQVADWPLHKKICKTVALEQKREYKERRKADHTLNPRRSSKLFNSCGSHAPLFHSVAASETSNEHDESRNCQKAQVC